MSKRSKERPVPPPKPPPPTKELPPDTAPPGDPPPSFVIELVRVDSRVLRESREGEPVTMRWEEVSPFVTTLTGIRLGDVKPEDAAKVRQRKSSEGHIVKINGEPAVTCFVKVR